MLQLFLNFYFLYFRKYAFSINIYIIITIYFFSIIIIIFCLSIFQLNFI